MPRTKKDLVKYVVIRDIQEKARFWEFPKSVNCAGTVDQSMKTGDYTLRGLEDTFIIERKATTGELSNNLTKKQFENELQRMEKFAHAYIVCEFTLEDMFNFPFNSGIPRYIWRKLKVRSNFLLSRIAEIESKHNVKFVFAGENGKEYAKIIFKQMVKLYPDKIINDQT